MFTSKRILASVLSVTMALCAAGCGASEEAGKTASANNTAVSAKIGDEAEKQISVVCTIFPEYDWVREIVGDNSNVEIWKYTICGNQPLQKWFKDHKGMTLSTDNIVHYIMICE